MTTNHSQRGRAHQHRASGCATLRLTVTTVCLDVVDKMLGKRCKCLTSKTRSAALGAYEPRGRGFKSCRARQLLNGLRDRRPFFFPPLLPCCYFIQGGGGR